MQVADKRRNHNKWPLIITDVEDNVKRGSEPEGERGSTVVYFPQQQEDGGEEKKEKKYQLICEIAPTPFPGYPRSTTVMALFEVSCLDYISATTVPVLGWKTKH